MERIADDLDRLRQANDELSRFFARFAGSPALGSDDEVEALLSMERTVREVGKLLDWDLLHSRDEHVRDELELYRQNLARLRRELSILQGSAIDCRARLFVRENHLQAARAWADTTGSTTPRL